MRPPPRTPRARAPRVTCKRCRVHATLAPVEQTGRDERGTVAVTPRVPHVRTPYPRMAAPRASPLRQGLRLPRGAGGRDPVLRVVCGWWAYVVYLPIFAVENALGDQLGGILLSITNAALFTSPLMLRWMQALGVRASVRTGFATVAVLFCVAGIGAHGPWAAVAALFTGSIFLIFLDICGGLPFLMAAKPPERTEMSAVYSSFRDVSGILTPGAAWMVLLVAPIAGVFMATGVAAFCAWGLAGRLHPRLGAARLRPIEA